MNNIEMIRINGKKFRSASNKDFQFMNLSCNLNCIKIEKKHGVLKIKIDSLN